MTKIMHVWSIIISVLLLSLSSCSKEDCEISVTGISLNKQSIEIKKVGQKDLLLQFILRMQQVEK